MLSLSNFIYIKTKQWGMSMISVPKYTGKHIALVA